MGVNSVQHLRLYLDPDIVPVTVSRQILLLSVNTWLKYGILFTFE